MIHGVTSDTETDQSEFLKVFTHKTQVELKRFKVDHLNVTKTEMCAEY